MWYYIPPLNKKAHFFRKKTSHTIKEKVSCNTVARKNNVEEAISEDWSKGFKRREKKWEVFWNTAPFLFLKSSVFHF